MLTLYKGHIDYLEKTSSKKEFFNSDSGHAKIVLTALFRTAKERVRVFCKDMLSEVNAAPEYIAEVKYFLERGGKLDILLHDYNESLKSKDIWNVLSSYIDKGQVSIKSNTEKGFKNEDSNIVHFTVVDKIAYRYEFDIEKKQARGFFNDPDTAIGLCSGFDQAFSAESSVVVS